MPKRKSGRHVFINALTGPALADHGAQRAHPFLFPMKTEAQEEIDQQNAVNAETVERVLRMLRLHQADPAFGAGCDEETEWLDG